MFLALVGAALGAASAAVAEDAGPAPVPVVYYDACHTLLVDTAVPNDVNTWDVRNLAQLAQRLTQGEIPAAVADVVDASLTDVSSQVRVAVRNDIQSLSVCSVGETPSAAELHADEFANQLLTVLNADASGSYDSLIAAAEADLSAARERVDAASAALDVALALDPTATFRDLRDEEALRRVELSSATSALRRIESGGSPVVPLETLESAEAVEISESTYDRRVRAGAAGANVEVGVGDDIGGAGGQTSSGGSAALPDGPLPRAGIGGLFGGAIGFGFVMFTERLDSRLRRKEDVELTLDLPVLAEIPPLSRRDRKKTQILSVEEPRSRTAESFRALRSALDYARRVDAEQGRAGNGAHVILVTSGAPSEGKTTTLSNLATVMAEGDRSVLAVNCDFRRPRLHRYLGGTAHAQRLNVTDVPGVQLVTQVTASDGDATPSDVVAAQRRLVERAREHFDVILLDTAPILTTNDAAELLAVCDHVVLVINTSHTKAEAAERAAELLARRGRAPLGVVLVGARDVPNASDYYYDDGDPYLESGKRRRGRRSERDTERDEAAVAYEVSPRR